MITDRRKANRHRTVLLFTELAATLAHYANRVRALRRSEYVPVANDVADGRGSKWR
jgi:hypothetical protein